MKSKLEIIEETAAFYTSENRSVEKGSSEIQNCMYVGPENKRCAFSRCCLDSPEVLRFLKGCEGDTAFQALELAQEEDIEILKEDYRGHEGKFWGELQAFHDYEGYWNEKGMTENGKERKNNLIKDWGEK